MAAQPQRDWQPPDGATWEQVHEADSETLKARGWCADVFAAFRAARGYYAAAYGDRLREAYGNEWAKVITQSFEVYAALLDAGENEDDGDEARRKSAVRRFPLRAYRAGEYLSCKRLPYIEDPALFEKRRGALERLWSRSGWRWVDMLQKVTGDALFTRDTPGFDGNKGNGECTYYTDRLNDVLTDTMRRARRSRSKRRDKFETAFVESLKLARRENRLPAYASKWEPAEKVSDEERTARASVRLYRAAPLAFCLAVVAVEEAKRPEMIAREILRRALARSRAVLKDSDASALDALQLEAHALVDEIFEGEELSAPGVCPPCVTTADSPDGAGEVAARASEVVCDFSAENNETPSPAADKNVRRTPPVEVLEFEPEAEPRGVSMSDADAALTACASAGIEKLLTVFTDDTVAGFEESCMWHDYSNPKQFRERLDGYLKRNETRGESMSVRLRFKDDFGVMQLDDCPPEALEALAPFSFLQVATSPGNGQAWIALSDRLDDASYKVLRFRLFNERSPLGKLGVNGGAHGSVRWPGSLNQKPKRRYADGAAPRVQLLRSALGLRVTVADLDAAGLLGDAPPKPDPRVVREIRGRLPKGWPDLNECYASCGNDRSRAEFVWCMKALRRGWPPASVENELAALGSKAAGRSRDSYIRDTVTNASRVLGLDVRSAPDAFDTVEVTL